MPDSLAQLIRLHEVAGSGYWADRALAQLDYAAELTRIDRQLDGRSLKAAVDGLSRRFGTDGAVTRQAVEEMEAALAPLASRAREHHILCVGHAHIDMNWMWSWQETVSITIETFRTMLDLLGEYDAFTFAQSQASVYHIVEQYAPEMLPEIRRYVDEGRWEVTASHWVEADKNMPSGESFVRHLLYTKAYLGKLLGLAPEALEIDFEPDTFGHSTNTPELLSKGGVKYYYHCRGSHDHDIYRWYAPSGASVLAYREPLWYNAEMNSGWARFVPSYCERNGIDTMLKVYGVGDHGGGPTRRDIEMLIDMQGWPIFPALRFGTYREWFSLLELHNERWPDVHGERNFIFSGCYTSQSRIKRGNRRGEEALYRAEWAAALAATRADALYTTSLFEEGWRNVLFNQFHDIIPGSGVIETREHAMGLYQETMAVAVAREAQALRAFCERIDTSAYGEEGDAMTRLPDCAHGAGVGFGVSRGKISQTGRGEGRRRIFVVFNPVFAEREEPVELVIWDWAGDSKRLRVRDSAGGTLACEVVQSGTNPYWGHRYLRLLVHAKLPSSGYATLVVDEDLGARSEPKFHEGYDFRVELPATFVLENELVRAELRSEDLSLMALIDKSSGENVVDGGRLHGGGLRLVREDDSKGMTSWQVGRYMTVNSLFETLHVTSLSLGEDRLCQSVDFKATFLNSSITGRVLLKHQSRLLDYELEVDWHEVGRRGEGIPQLQYHIPASFHCATYAYDVPCGVIRRDGCAMDVPANAWAMAEPADDAASALMLIGDSKHGFRGDGDALSISLIRGSFDPDPYPEYGVHTIRLAVGPVADRTNLALAKASALWRHAPMVMATRASAGPLPATASLAAIESGSVQVMSVKQPEAAQGLELIVRLVEMAGEDTTVILRFPAAVHHASLVDLHERPMDGPAPQINGDRVHLRVGHGSIVSLRLALEG